MDTTAKLEFVARIATAYFSGNRIASSEVTAALLDIGRAFDLIVAPTAASEVFTPAVNPKSSVKDGVIISLIDGKPYKMLKRHLGRHGLTPDDYRARYGLPASYPMVAPSYSQVRSQLARDTGLGRKPAGARA